MKLNFGFNDYLKRALSLLPHGNMARTEDSNWAKVLTPAAKELEKVTLRVVGLLKEADPRTTLELFEEWENFAGLPNPCSPSDSTFGERRDALIEKIKTNASPSRAYFKQVAEELGYDIDIYEFRTMGFGNWGFGANDVSDAHGRYFIGPQTPDNKYQYYWLIYVYGTKFTRFAFGGSAFGDALLYIRGGEELECALPKIKPADSHLSFVFIED